MHVFKAETPSKIFKFTDSKIAGVLIFVATLAVGYTHQLSRQQTPLSVRPWLRSEILDCMRAKTRFDCSGFVWGLGMLSLANFSPLINFYRLKQNTKN